MSLRALRVLLSTTMEFSKIGELLQLPRRDFGAVGVTLFLPLIGDSSSRLYEFPWRVVRGLTVGS